MARRHEFNDALVWAIHPANGIQVNMQRCAANRATQNDPGRPGNSDVHASILEGSAGMRRENQKMLCPTDPVFS